MKNSNSNKYIEEAKEYYRIALEELAEASKNGKSELAVDGCEKGWLSFNLALKAMFVLKGVEEEKLPKGYRGVYFFLKKYGDRKLRRIYGSAYGRLHIRGFWERDPDYEEDMEVLEDIKEYIEQIESQIGNK